jgi:Icc protein
MSKISRRGFIKSSVALSALPLVAYADERKDRTDLKFIHVTDSHMDLDVKESVDAIKLMVSFINKKYPEIDFVLFGGDNFNNNIEKGADAVAFKEILSGLHCPFYLVRGNKESSPLDKGYGIDFERYKTLFMQDDALHVEGKDWALQKHGYMILGLDSCVENHNNGRYTKETIAFAKKMLEKKKPTILLNHHPYTNYWGGTEEKDLHKYLLNNTKEVQEALFGYKNLKLTLSGHKHIDSVSKIADVDVIVTRGFIRPLDKNQYPMRYIAFKDQKMQEKLIYTSETS